MEVDGGDGVEEGATREEEGLDNHRTVRRSMSAMRVFMICGG